MREPLVIEDLIDALDLMVPRRPLRGWREVTSLYLRQDGTLLVSYDSGDRRCEERPLLFEPQQAVVVQRLLFERGFILDIHMAAETKYVARDGVFVRGGP